MKKEDVEYFAVPKRNVKITLYPNFSIIGHIDRVSDDCFIFTTSQKSSLIKMADLKTIVEW